MEYHKIQTCFKRTERGEIVFGDWSLPEFEYLQDNLWTFTEKVDGTNIRIIWSDEKIKFGGKTDNAQIPAFLVDRLRTLFDGKENLFREKFPDAPFVCLYGEGFGAKIQKGGGNYIPNGVDFVLFDVRIGDWWLQRKDVEDIGNYFGLPVVPVIGEGKLSDAVALVKKGFDSRWGSFMAEGIVMRPKTELKTRRGDRIITKIKYKDFIKK